MDSFWAHIHWGSDNPAGFIFQFQPCWSSGCLRLAAWQKELPCCICFRNVYCPKSQAITWICPSIRYECVQNMVLYIYIIIIIIIIYIIYYFYNLAFNVGSIHVNPNHMGFRASHSCSSRRQWTCSLWTWDSKLRTGWWSTTHFMAWLEGKSTGNPWYFYVFLSTHDRGLQKKWSLQLQNQSND